MAEKKEPKTDKKEDTKKPVKQTKPKEDIKKKQTVKKTETKKTPVKKTQTKAKPKTTKKPAAKKTETKKEEKPVKKEEPKGKDKVEEKKEEEKYKVKKKPKISKEVEEKLTVRKEIKKRTPEFLREEWFRYKRVPKNWRRPDGITSKMRRNFKYRPSKVRVGFRGPRDVRGLHPSGFEEILVYKAGDLTDIDPEKQAIRIGGSVGTKKRLDIEKKAAELDIRILNM